MFIRQCATPLPRLAVLLLGCLSLPACGRQAAPTPRGLPTAPMKIAAANGRIDRPPPPEFKEPDAPPPAADKKGTPPPASDKKAKITRDEYDSIELGMTEKQVVDLLGETANQAANGDKKTLAYLSPDSKRHITVHFQNGKVVLREGTLLSDQDPPSLTRGNYDKIMKGMAREELVKLMGQPNTECDPNPENENKALMSWGVGDKRIEVDLKDGKVVDHSIRGFE